MTKDHAEIVAIDAMLSYLHDQIMGMHHPMAAHVVATEYRARAVAALQALEDLSELVDLMPLCAAQISLSAPLRRWRAARDRIAKKIYKTHRSTP